MGQVASTVYNIFSLKGGGGEVVFSDSGTTLFNTTPPADTDEIDLFKSTKSFKSPVSDSSSSSVGSYKSITGVSPMSESSSSSGTSPSLLTPSPVVPIISTYTANAIELLITPLPGSTTLTRKPSIGSTAIETSYLANTSYKFFFGYEIIKGYTSANNMKVEIMNTSPTSTNIRSLRQTLLEKWLSTDTTTHQTTLNLTNIDEYLQHFYRMFIYNTIANKELTKNKSKYDNNINTFVKIAKDGFNNMLTDTNNCITFWKQLAKNATSTLSANYGLELEHPSLRTLIESTSAGFNKTSSQCEILFDTKLDKDTTHTCAFCGIQFTVKKDNSQVRGMSLFSCEHVLEVFPLAMILGLTPNMNLYDAQTKEYLQQLYVNFGSYVIACQRCNMIKSKLQSNETYGILVDLIQQGTTNNELEFVRNDWVIEEFVNRICDPLDTNGGSYIRQVYDYTASTYPDLVNDLATPFSYYYKKSVGKPFEVLINNSYDKWLIVNNAHPGYDIPTIPTIPAFENDGKAHVYFISPFPDAYKSQPDNIQIFKNSLITRIRNILNPLVSNLNLMCNLWSHPQIKITPGILDIAGSTATNDEINQLKGKFNTHGFILRILASFPMIFLEVLNNKRKTWINKMHENTIPPSQYLINGGRCNPLYGGGEKRKKTQSVDNTSPSPSHKIKRVDKDEVLNDIFFVYVDSENPILDLYLQLHSDFIDIIEKIGINYLLNNVNNTNNGFNVKSNFIHLIEQYQKLFCIHPTHVQLNGATIWIEPTTNNVNILSNINNIKYNNYFIYTAGEDRSNPDEVVKFNNFEKMGTNDIIKIITMLNDIIDKFNDLFRSSHVDCSEMYTSVINDKTNIPTNQCNIQNIFTNASNNAVEMINKDNPQTCTSKCKGILRKLININLLHTWVPPNDENNNAKQIKKGGTFSNNNKTIKSRIKKRTQTQTRKKRMSSTKKKKNTKQRSQTKRN